MTSNLYHQTTARIIGADDPMISPPASKVDVNASTERNPKAEKKINWAELPDGEIPDLFPQLRTPPVSRFWDPDDPTTWGYYKDFPDRFLLLPYALPLVIGKEIFCRPVFELFSIEIRRLDPQQQNFHMILFRNESTGYVPLVIYKRGGVEFATDQPLPLKGPIRPPNGACSVMIALTNPISGGWYFEFRPKHEKFKYDEPVRKVFKDEVAYSEAVILYEVIKEAVKATLEFQFIPKGGEGKRKRKECPIQILQGTIFATHNGNAETKRMVKQFSSSHQMTNTMLLPVDRFVFGVPKGSTFQVTAENLIYTTTTTRGGGGGGGEQGSRFRISETFSFHVPTHCASEVKFFNSTGAGPRLRLTVSWSDARR